MAPPLRQLRLELGWSQARMGDELGISQPTVWRIEHGEQQPSKSVEKLIDSLAVRVQAARALGLTEKPKPVSIEPQAVSA